MNWKPIRAGSKRPSLPGWVHRREIALYLFKRNVALLHFEFDKLRDAGKIDFDWSFPDAESPLQDEPSRALPVQDKYGNKLTVRPDGGVFLEDNDYRDPPRYIEVEHLSWEENPDFDGPTLSQNDPFLENGTYEDPDYGPIIPSHRLKVGLATEDGKPVEKIWITRNKKVKRYLMRYALTEDQADEFVRQVKIDRGELIKDADMEVEMNDKTNIWADDCGLSNEDGKWVETWDIPRYRWNGIDFEVHPDFTGPMPEPGKDGSYTTDEGGEIIPRFYLKETDEGRTVLAINKNASPHWFGKDAEEEAGAEVERPSKTQNVDSPGIETRPKIKPEMLSPDPEILSPKEKEEYILPSTYTNKPNPQTHYTDPDTAETEDPPESPIIRIAKAKIEIQKAKIEIQRSLGGEVKADGHIGPATINAMAQREEDLNVEIIKMQQEAEDLNVTISFFRENLLPEAEPSL